MIPSRVNLVFTEQGAIELYRIQVSSSSTGPYNFQCEINPVEYDPSDSFNISGFATINTPSVYQYKCFDSRIRELKWDKFAVSTSSISSIYDYFRSVEGQIRYFNFKDLDDINLGWPNSDTWKKARVISLKSEYQKGGKLKYDSMILSIQPEK